MSYNKNGLEIKLDFEHSLNTQNLEDIKDPTSLNTIEKNVSSIFFLPKPKEIPIFQKYTDNLVIISKKKPKIEYIITKISKFDLINNKNDTKELPKNKNYELVIIDKITLVNTKNEIPENIIISKENENENKKEEKKLFLNLNISNENTIVIKGSKIIPEEKEKEKENIKEEPKLFLNLNVSNGNTLVIQGIKKEIKLDTQSQVNNIEIKGIPKEIEKKFTILNIENKVINIEILKVQVVKKEIELKTERMQAIEIKPTIKEKVLSIESNLNLVQIYGVPPKPPEKKVLNIQKNIITIEIIQNAKLYENKIVNIINFEIKHQKKKSEIVLKKVDNFININDKLYAKKKNTSKEQEIKENKEKEKKNKKVIKQKLDVLKTKSPNQIQINRIVPNAININNNNSENKDSNDNNNENKDNNDINNNQNNNSRKNNNNKEKNDKLALDNENINNNNNINTMENEILNNKESIQFPVINNDIILLEKQYEKIKRDLNELYPVFSKNKQYRENFFVQLSQGHQGKYNFYLNLYKIIKDEHDEKEKNNFENFLKMKKIIEGNNKGMNYKNKTRLRPLKKKSSSSSIIARNKYLPSYTEENNYY